MNLQPDTFIAFVEDAFLIDLFYNKKRKMCIRDSNAAVETVTPEKKEMEMEKEIQEQTLDMERLNDLLSDVYRKAEFCTAFLYSDKNKCRNLLKERCV